MITKVEARSYRCLQNVSQELHPFEILIGPNASGKSSFLDVDPFSKRCHIRGPRRLSEYYRDDFSIEPERAIMVCGQDLSLLPARTIATATA